MIEWPDDALKECVNISTRFTDHLNIIDIGAHYGETFQTLASNLQSQFSYVGLEPDPKSFKIYNKNSHAILESSNCLSFVSLNQAASSSSGSEEFTKTKADAVSGLLKPVKGLSERVLSGDHEIIDTFTVQTTTIDQIIRKQSFSKVSLLKIDTEGFDLECLKGAAEALENNLIDIIMCEAFFVRYREGQCYFWDIASFLQKHNYYFVNIFDSRETDQGRLYTANGVWVSPEYADKMNYL
jgi:FkbM family methyltransferase